MTKLKLKMSLERYDRTAPILDGRVKVPGIEIDFAGDDYVTRHTTMAWKQAYDLAEFSGAGLFTAREHDAPIIGLPFFPRRLFSYSFIYVNVDSKINEPRDLIGKKVGIPTYGMTMAVLARGDLQHEFDISPNKIRWVKTSEELYEFSKPKNLELTQINGNKATLEQMLVKREINAMIHPTVIKPFRESSPKVKRLFPDFQEREEKYYRKKRVFPIMHVIMAKKELAEKYPEKMTGIIKALEESKRICYEELSHPAYTSIVWGTVGLERQRRLLGEDPFPMGIEPNRKAIEQLMQLCLEQGLISKEMELESLFALA